MEHEITIRQMRGFVALCRDGSFTAAATRIGITQSGLSLLVQAIERSMGVVLIDRIARPLVPTEAGKRFLPIAERILEDVDFVSSHSLEFDGQQGGRIVVASLPTLSATVMPRAIVKFRKRFPDVAVHLRDVLTDEIVARVRSGDAHIGLGAFLDYDQDLTMNFLFRDRLTVLANPKMLSRKSIPWRALAKYPVILMSKDSNIRQISDRMFMDLRIDLKPAFEVSYIATGGALVAEGLGIAIVPATEGAVLAQKGLRLVELIDPPAWREIGVLMRRTSTISPPLRHLIDLLRSAQLDP